MQQGEYYITGAPPQGITKRGAALGDYRGKRFSEQCGERMDFKGAWKDRLEVLRGGKAAGDQQDHPLAESKVLWPWRRKESCSLMKLFVLYWNIPWIADNSFIILPQKNKKN